jgi:hypothetical protein
MTEPYDSFHDTQQHIYEVRELLHRVALALIERGRWHDSSKFTLPEKTAYDRVTPKLKGVAYGSDEYTKVVAELGDALKHHYANNSHHPEHYPDGIAGMDLLDVVEMVCDWVVAGRRNEDQEVNMMANIVRFRIQPQLVSILTRTVRDLERQ